MLYQLKNNISIKSGFKIKNRGDCVRLSSMISIETDYDLSYNTLGRFYGIVKGTAPSERTLNILSKYVGFSSYKDFCFNYPQKKNWAIYQRIYNSLYTDTTTFYFLKQKVKCQLKNPISFASSQMINKLCNDCHAICFEKLP